MTDFSQEPSQEPSQKLSQASSYNGQVRFLVKYVPNGEFPKKF